MSEQIIQIPELSIELLARSPTLDVELLAQSPALDVELGAGGISYPIYDGPYTVTPGDQQQVLHTNLKTMMQDLVVEAIPSNYGKITWNGSVMTIT